MAELTERDGNSGPLKAPPVVPGYRLVVHERIPVRRASLAGLASVPLWLAAFLVASAALDSPYRLRFHLDLAGVIGALLIVLVGIPLVHEAIHGLVARLLGARPSYGIGMGFAYTTFREPVSRGVYQTIGMAPLLLISLAGLALLVWWPRGPGLTLIFMVGNAAGAAGDLWVVWRTLSVPTGARICDLADGFAVYLPE